MTAGVLLTGYAGYYLCRSNLSVVAPLLMEEFSGQGFDKASFGLITSAGALAYAAGKLATGVLTDFVGGRLMFVAGMVGSVAATVAFGLSSGAAAFAVIWAFNRLLQSGGWNAVVKVSAHWFPPQRAGAVMAILSLSFLFGDAVVRIGLGALIARGFGWREVFFVAAAVLALLAVVSAALLKSRPQDAGLPAQPVNPANLFGNAGVESRPDTLSDLLRPYVTSTSFWLVCVVSLGLTLVREAFGAWTPTYLVETYQVSQADAAQMSSVFPLVGGVSVLLVGFLSDASGPGRRATVVAPCLAAAVPTLLLLGVPGLSVQAGLALLAVSAFLIVGPYSLLAGAMAMDLGARRGSSTAAGLIDTAGYLGAAVSGYGVGLVAEQMGWSGVFRLLAATTAVTFVAAVAYGRVGQSRAPAAVPI